MVESKFRAWFERAQASGDQMSRKDREVPMRSISPRPGRAGDKQPSSGNSQRIRSCPMPSRTLAGFLFNL
jgi:hypothetical protein